MKKRSMVVRSISISNCLKALLATSNQAHTWLLWWCVFKALFGVFFNTLVIFFLSSFKNTNLFFSLFLIFLGFFIPLAQKTPSFRVQDVSAIAVRLKEVKIPLVFYRAGNIHADFKEPFVLAFNV